MAATPVERERSSSLARGLAVLRVLLDEPFGLTLAVVAERTGLSRAAARRFLLTLADDGLVQRCGKRFLPTLRVRTLGHCALADPAFWARFEPAMKVLSIEHGESCSIAVLDGTDIEYVARMVGPRVLSVSLAVGSRLPAVTTSMGRVLLAAAPDEEREARVRGASPEHRTARTLVDPGDLLDRIAAAAADGYAIVDQELEDDLISVAVPLHAPNGCTFAALNLSSTPSRLSPEALRTRVVPSLIEASARMAACLVDPSPGGW